MSESLHSAYSVEKLRLPEGLAADSIWLRQLEVNGDDGVPAGSARRFVLRVLDRSARSARPHAPIS